jgi:hypothetical protein
MIDDRDILRHLEEGGAEVFNRPDPPKLDLAAITGESTASASAPTRRPARTWSLRPFMAVGGALACMAIGLLGGALLFDDAAAPTSPAQNQAAAPTTITTPARTRQVSLTRFDATAPAHAAAEVNVFTATDGRTVDLRVHGLPAPRKGEFYELWVLGEEGKMISLGIVRVDAKGSAVMRMPLPVSLRRFPVFDLSLEPGDGNPTHSGKSILRSAAAA